MNKHTSLILSVAIVAAVGIGLFATTNIESDLETSYIGGSLPDFSVDYLAEETTYAIKGKVVDIVQISPEIDEFGITNVFTDVVIDVKKDLNGLYDEDQITVRMQGGIRDNVKVVMDTSPEFEIGENVFIFVGEKEPESIYGDNYYVAGLQHGKYNLDEVGKAKNQNSDRDLTEKQLDDKIKKSQDKKKSK